MENTSGQGGNAAVPAEIDRWNWGAFLLNWIWGIGNNTYLALLMFVPFANLVMPFVLGAKGSSWAWRNKRWASVEEFRAVQRQWARWGVALAAACLLAVAGLAVAVVQMLKSSDAYRLAVATVDANPQAAELFGRPMTAGLPSGSIEVSGPDGSASLSFSLRGPKGEGTAYCEARKDLGRWRIERLAVEDETGRRIEFAGQ